jgi:hypothetical protein
MFRLFKLIAALAVVNAVGVSAPITLTFDFHVYAKFIYAQQAYDSSFVPRDITISVTLDSEVTQRDGYPTNSRIYFGAPEVVSPLTGILPYGPGTPIDPPAIQRSALMSGFNYGSGVGDAGSYFQIQENQSDPYGPVLLQ